MVPGDVLCSNRHPGSSWIQIPPPMGPRVNRMACGLVVGETSCERQQGGIMYVDGARSMIRRWEGEELEKAKVALNRALRNSMFVAVSN